jgi:tryptophan synthase
LGELETAYLEATKDPAFWKEFEDMFGYINRPSQLYFADRLTEEMGGAKIWLKSVELDLNWTELWLTRTDGKT